MRQLLYASSRAGPELGDSLASILVASRHNNALDGVTGLLWTDGTRFLQVLEGGNDAVTTTFERIRLDPRHRAIVVLHDRQIEQRTFSTWSMALLGDSDDRLDRALEDADPVVRGTFEGLIVSRRN